MADNVTLPGTGTSVAADDVGGALYQRVKLSVGADGAAADLAPGQATMSTSLPVAIASNQSAIPVTDNSGSLTVDVGTALPAGSNNIGDVDVLTVPAPLSTTGGGTEATALRVTVATDSTGVVSVDDNGGSLSVDDGGGTLTVDGTVAVSSVAGTVAVSGPLTDTQLRASAVPVSDGSSSLTVDSAQLPTALATGGGMKIEGVSGGVAVSVGGAAADDAAASGNPVPVGAVFLATVDEVDANDVGWLRMTARRALIGAPDFGFLLLTEATPVPAGSDIRDDVGNPIEASDLAIRDTNNKYFLIPISFGYWRKVIIELFPNNFDQALTVTLIPTSYVYKLLEFTVPSGSTNRVGIGSGAVGIGGSAGAATLAASSWYDVPALAAQPYGVYLQIKASVAPSTGTLSIRITRST